MRLQVIQPDGNFKEFMETRFDAEHVEAVLERWLEQNPHAILEDSSVLIIGRQVGTNLGGFVDLLGLDRAGDVVVMELKRGRTPRDTLAQALEYASFAETLDSDELEELFQRYHGEESTLAEYHRAYFKLGAEEAVSFNKEQRVVLVGQMITEEIRQTATYLGHKGLNVTCVQFTFFESAEGKQLLSSDIVVGGKSAKRKKVVTGAQRKVSESEFMDSLDADGQAFFGRLFQFGSDNELEINWGSNGFSMNTLVEGTRVVLCFGYRPESVFGQSLYTVLYRVGGLVVKTSAPTEEAETLARELRETGLFQSAGQELKCQIDRSFSEEEMKVILGWLGRLQEAIQTHGLAE